MNSCIPTTSLSRSFDGVPGRRRGEYRNPYLLFATVLVALCGGLVSTATAKPVPAWAYWTAKQANANVIRANPQAVSVLGHATTITSAACAARGTAKQHRYRSFTCAVRYHDDTLDCCDLGVRLYVTTSAVKRNALGCWSRSPAALARGECRPPKVGG